MRFKIDVLQIKQLSFILLDIFKKISKLMYVVRGKLLQMMQRLTT